jgi:inner membrane protein
MSDSEKHLLFGAILGGTTYLLMRRLVRQEARWPGFLGCICAGAALALLPDALEPATSPNHRQFFHSLTALSGLVYGASKVLTSPTLAEDEKTWLLAATSGYVSHLLMDAATPKSLPIV